MYYEPSPYSAEKMDLHAKTEAISPQAHDAHVDAHMDARGIA